MPFQIVRNDITKMRVDAIVNAANNTLLGGGGVDGAIHRAAGPGLLLECMKLGGCKTGQAKCTGGYNLPSKYVIHTVGPVWEGGQHGEKALLESCYRESLKLALESGCESVAFPLISAGVYGYPREQALKVAAETIAAFVEEHDLLAYLVVYDRASFVLSESIFDGVASYIDQNYVEADKYTYREEARRRENLLRLEKRSTRVVEASICAAPARALSLEEMLAREDAGFTQTLLKLIDRTGKKDSAIYKKANISKQHFSKIRNNPDYKPTKPTALALALALELDLEETRDLIGRAGYALTNSSKFDLIIRYFIERKIYNIVQINLVLFQYDQSLLGM